MSAPDSSPVCAAGSRYTLANARLPEVKRTAGTAAFVVDDVLPAGAAYLWSINHRVPVSDPMELFPLATLDVDGTAR